ncbi:glycosyl transferase family 2 [Paraburkholderia sp. BL8N3]|nr:glycosyltransferase family A protein [Paraburkholderia sp. BL8N3]TCK43966.1 glycosyl transferase family 2 [Paraburkholderia sp. BL8N3]
MNDMITIVIRTMPGREKHLDKCLFILTGQTHSNIEVVVVAQQLNESDSLELIHDVALRWASHFQGGVTVLNHVSPTDARARSLNLGKEGARGRFLAFLDDDDKVYPGHYQKLIESLQKTDFAWAYADVIRALYNEYGQLVSRSSPFKRDEYSYLDHLRGNFIPIHSFVIDTERASDAGKVDETMSRNEDYEFILRLAFRHEPLYVPGFAAEYCIRSDGSNTVSDGTGHARDSLKKRRLWNAAEDMLEEKKTENFGWWVRELERLPMVHHTDSVTYGARGADYGRNSGTFQRMLKEYYESTSWRITRPLRNFSRRLRGRPSEVVTIPPNDNMARAEIDRILLSTSWEITAPMRVVSKIVSRIR